MTAVRVFLSIFGVAVMVVSCAVLEHMPAQFKDEEAIKVETPDGVELNLLRFVPKRDLVLYPVLLIPDSFLSADEFFAGPRGGLAAYLAERGFEVFSVELRGMGSSSSAVNPKLVDWCFDDWLEVDLPAVLGAVTRNSSKDKVIIVGHGLGGTLAMLAGSKYPERVAAVVGLGSPGGVWRPPNKLLAALLTSSAKITDEPIEVGDYLGLPAPFASEQALVDILLFNDSGFENGAASEYFEDAPGYLSSCLLRRLAGWYESGIFLDREGEADILEGLDGFVQPALLIAGKLDHLYCPGEVLIAYETIPANDKELFIASRVNRLMVDYGHMGLVMGPYADRDIYKHVVKWARDRFSR